MKPKTLAIGLFLAVMYIVPLSSLTYKYYAKQAKVEQHHLHKEMKKKEAV
ncbi:hypothetical protein K1X76_10655 [bacterium]|nr:hypothetical protein [bacterium]